jgi:hypothetical protein
MKSCLITFLFLVSLLQATLGQPGPSQSNPPGPGDPGYKPGSGTTICVDVPRTLDAKKLKLDEEIVARVTADLIYDGKVIVPREAKVLGKVADLKLAAKDDPETRLLLEFEKIVTKDGREFQFEFPAFIQALAPERRAAGFQHQSQRASDQGRTRQCSGPCQHNADPPGR